MAALVEKVFPARNYALGETLASGQAFRWRPIGGAWEGVIHGRWVQLQENPESIRARVVSETEAADWQWLVDYLQLNIDIDQVTGTFPRDEHLKEAVAHCRGLRLLRQEPWECLASFILSSTKQIVQIQQIVQLVCERFGDSVPVPSGHPPVYAFPGAQRLAGLSEADLRCCKMGFRAPYLKGAAEMVTGGEVNLRRVGELAVEDARAQLMRLPGVGRKIADCVLLFAYGFQQAFPVDVWVIKALQQLYFPRRRRKPAALLKFTETYFGPNAGYAQQYLFHYMRTRIGRSKNAKQKT